MGSSEGENQGPLDAEIPIPCPTCELVVSPAPRLPRVWTWACGEMCVLRGLCPPSLALQVYPASLCGEMSRGVFGAPQGSAWRLGCSSDADRQVAVLGQKTVLSCSGPPSGPGRRPAPTWNPGWVRLCWPHQPQGVGHACWCHRASHGTSLSCSQTRVIRGWQGHKCQPTGSSLPSPCLHGLRIDTTRHLGPVAQTPHSDVCGV